jgi:hypothetical protein
MSAKAKSLRQKHIKESHQVIQEALLQAGKKSIHSSASSQLQVHRLIAQALGVSTSMLYKWREPNPRTKTPSNPLDRVATLIIETGDERILDWLAQKAGGHFQRDEVQSHPDKLPTASHTLVKEYSLLIARIVSMVEDHQVTPDESQELRERWDEIRKKTESFVRACEKGTYGTLEK